MKYTSKVKILPQVVVFEWDQGNRDKNFTQQGVSHQEAEVVLGNKPLLISEDLKHSENESRFQALGKINQGRLLFLSFTIRNDKIRVISVRDMNRVERIIYEKI